jgi:phage replication O-like protein O
MENTGNPQVENGYTKIANELLEALAAIRIPGEAMQVLLIIIRKTYGFNKKSDWIALSQFSDGTGINKPHIIRAIKRLVDMNIVAKKGNGIGVSYCLNKNYKLWKPLPKKATLPKKAMGVAQKGNDRCQKRQKTLPKKVPTKEKRNYTKETITKDRLARFRLALQSMVDDKKLDQYKAKGIDINTEIIKMERWVDAEPVRGNKKNFNRFITGWLNRSLDNDGGQKTGPGGKPKISKREDFPETGETTL